MSQSRLKSWWRGVRPRVLAFPIYCVVRALLATVRIEVIGREKYTGGPYLLAGWHGRTMLATKVFRGKGIWTIISLSNDGNMQTRIFQRFGFRVVRGSLYARRPARPQPGGAARHCAHVTEVTSPNGAHGRERQPALAH